MYVGAQMNSRWLWGIPCVLAACEPLPPEPKQHGQTPEFTVLSAAPAIGSIDFSITNSGHLEGTLVLERDVAVAHPLLLSVVWSEPWVPTAVYTLSRPLLHQADQQLIGTYDRTAGTRTVSADVAFPPDAVKGGGCGTNAAASLVVFVDVNENGLLDLTEGAAIDHVISSSDFPTAILGDQRFQRRISFQACAEPIFSAFEAHQALYEDPLLDLVSCTKEERFADPRVCGSDLITNAIWFKGDRSGDFVTISVNSHTQVTVLVDGLTRGLAIPQTGGFPLALNELGEGRHAIRAENVDGVVWEATFTFPDRTWIRYARPVGSGEYEVDFQEIAGASSYQAEGGGQLGRWVTGVSSPIQVPAEHSVSVVASFGELPFTCRASAELDR